MHYKEKAKMRLGAVPRGLRHRALPGPQLAQCHFLGNQLGGPGLDLLPQRWVELPDDIVHVGHDVPRIRIWKEVAAGFKSGPGGLQMQRAAAALRCSRLSHNTGGEAARRAVSPPSFALKNERAAAASESCFAALAEIGWKLLLLFGGFLCLGLGRLGGLLLGGCGRCIVGESHDYGRAQERQTKHQSHQFLHFVRFSFGRVQRVFSSAPIILTRT